MGKARNAGGWVLLSFACAALFVGAGVGCEQSCSTSCDLDVPPIVFPGATVSTDSLFAYIGFWVDARGLLTTCDCLYGTTPAMGDTTTRIEVEGVWGPQPLTVSFPLGQRNATYFYSCRAFSSAGMAVASIDSFVYMPPNVLPMTALSYSSEGAEPGTYRIRLNWFGWDPDGWIDHFEIRTEIDGDIPDWLTTVSTDSIVFISDLDFETYWRFTVRSVDNRGGIDPTPESVTLLPRGDLVSGSPEHSGGSERPN